MNKFLKSISVLLFAGVSFAQVNTLSQTTTTTAVLATDSVINVVSTSAMNAYSLPGSTPASELYMVSPGNQRGEIMTVLSVISSTQVKVNRRGEGGIRSGFPSGSTVLVGSPNWFYDYDPGSGSCVAANVFVTPWVNTKTGNEWLCSTVTGTWVPGFNNDVALDAPTAAVASAAGLITPSGPLFHITGTSAITGFNIPTGFTFGGFCVIPDGIFTTTNANNIALASTAVVSKEICWVYDPNTTKFYPSY